MRKIRNTITHNKKTFQPMYNVFIKDEDGNKEVSSEILLSSYDAVTRLNIHECNRTLISNGEPPMDDEEIVWFVTGGVKSPVPTPTEIQELAGFKVQKTITYE